MKVFKDNIYGSIELPDLCVEIINTKQFQRLRNVSQLSSLKYIYPGASNDRFQHSIGTAHLAGVFVRAIQEKQSELHITDTDVLCVQLAGLCHDLGHGIHSHSFDTFMEKVEGNNLWKHELMSIKVFEEILKQPRIQEVFYVTYGMTRIDVDFICEMICASLPMYKEEDNQFKGRTPNKHFLYEIVSNATNGIDVDRMDYLLRDSMYLNIPTNFHYERLIHSMRAIYVEGRYRLCFRDNVHMDLFDLINSRLNFHLRAYKHPTGAAIEIMFQDVLLAANDHLLLPYVDKKTKNLEMMKINEIAKNPKAFQLIDDTIFSLIRFDFLKGNEKLKNSVHLLDRIDERRLYRLLDDRPIKIKNIDIESLEEKIVEVFNDVEPLDFVLNRKHIVIKIIRYDYGMKSKNPFDEIFLYRKTNTTQAFKLAANSDNFHAQFPSIWYPEKIQETRIRLFVKLENDLFDERIKSSFSKSIQYRISDAGELTPDM
ncbi:hypothetical protein SNEBB_000760 [Seison nebaliae]|nr:hypothetical protein SNEBB_000760 [Seison nebaliae]